MNPESPTSPLDIDRSQSSGTCVLRLAGEFDLAGIPRFERELERAIEGHAQVVAVDLRGLTFMDSSGLRALILADRELRENGRRCVVVKGSERINTILEMTGVADRLEIVPELADSTA